MRCLPQLRDRFPDVTIVPETMPTTAQLTALRAESIGLGIGWATGGITGVRATVLSTERFMALVPAAHPLAGRTELSASELSTTDLLTWPHQINSGLCDRLLSAFHIGGADLRIIRTADSVHAIAAHVAAGTGIGITVESALDHQPPGLCVIPLTGPSTTADQVVLTPAEPRTPPPPYATCSCTPRNRGPGAVEAPPRGFEPGSTGLIAPRGRVRHLGRHPQPIRRPLPRRRPRPLRRRRHRRASRPGLSPVCAMINP